ncbi:hypothetical protein GCM10008927_12060 [Amylibacter ulvae]|uniref:Glycosyl transferase family 2 n=1 Tax=Paramylibacter ulvae TaxID=1651968 RepID=A0ABQ3CZB8_9RHOB|nr:glycosyltransferase family 2 protein [Amylibacter ulvae]GHA48561.1 hypothetical protein GCM10008927_12060 [Amylibacter ulvae]
MKFWDQYRLRLERKRRRARSLRKRRELTPAALNVSKIQKNDVILFSTLRNEKIRLPFFFEYYRKMGVNHFCLVDNGSDDGTLEYLISQPDVSVWHTTRSYKRAGFGMDWLNGLLGAYAVGHWCLIVDVDEFFVYPHCDTRPIQALTHWLDQSSTRSFGTQLVDTYPKGKISEAHYRPGDNPMTVSDHFDAGNYYYERNRKYGNLWIQGGARQRGFFAGRPAFAPALNKIPLVKWKRGNVFVSSTHNLLPRSLNLVYAHNGGQRASGCLVHTKFLEMFSTKTKEELARKQHYAASREYNSYSKHRGGKHDLWNGQSVKYKDWRQLETLGLMSSGDWA